MLKLKHIQEHFIFIFDAIVLSYSQIFFSNKRWFGLAILLLTLINPYKTLIGVSSVIIAVLVALAFNFNREHIKSGLYTYNTLLVGIGIGSLFEFSAFTFLNLAFYSILSLFISVVIHNSFEKKGLPILSLPFLLCIWMAHIASSSYGAYEYNQEIDELLPILSPISTQFSSFINYWFLPDFFHILFKSISAIFYIYNDLVGFLILVIILIYSRVSFTLTILGFTLGILFFKIFLGDFEVLVSGYTGFNFILIAISLGGFFIVPSTKSFIFQVFTISLSCILLGVMVPFFKLINIPIYSLPFILVVLLSLKALKSRLYARDLILVTNQQFQPEQNAYKYYYNQLRFKAQTYFHIYLPFMGEWYVSQGIKGGITHLSYWENAWDFDIRNHQNKTYSMPGTDIKDFYAYDIPVTAPVSGYVVNILDHVPDNLIGQVNTTFNWGNTVVIKVAEYFYVQLSHLKEGSIKVALGEFVTLGQVIGTCGNSGRSPEPHIHFQIQTTPDIGSKTLKYPLAYYLTKKGDFNYQFNSFNYPKERETIKNIIPSSLLYNAFNFTPNHTIEWEINENNETIKVQWKILVDAYNRSYFYDEKNNTYAYFKNDGTLFYFYDYIGTKQSYLFLFYLTAQKIMLANYKHVEINDWVLPNYIFARELLWMQDFISPFIQAFKGYYQSYIESFDNDFNPIEVNYKSQIYTKILGYRKEKLHAHISIKESYLNKININYNNKNITMLCLGISPF